MISGITGMVWRKQNWWYEPKWLKSNSKLSVHQNNHKICCVFTLNIYLNSNKTWSVCFNKARYSFTFQCFSSCSKPNESKLPLFLHNKLLRNVKLAVIMMVTRYSERSACKKQIRASSNVLAVIHTKDTRKHEQCLLQI